jgi:hypothetical protein
LCILYGAAVIALYGVKAALSPLPLVIESIAVAEILFYLLVYLPYRYHLQREALHPETLSRIERKDLFMLCNKNIPDAEAYLRKWFMGAPAEEIKRENLKEFLLWAFFNRGGPPGDDDEELEEYISLTEELLGRDVEPGRGNAECLRLTLDRVDMMHRTLVWYLVGLNAYAAKHSLTRPRLSAWSISSPTCPSCIMASTFIAWLSRDSSPYFHSDRKPSSLPSDHPLPTSRIGTASIRRKRNFPSSLFTA